MERLALATLAGCVAGLWVQPAVTPVLLSIAVLPVIALLIWRGWPACACLWAVYCWAAMHAGHYQGSLGGSRTQPHDRSVSGCVIDFPRRGEGVSSFLFRVAGSDGATERLYLRSFSARWEPVAGHCYDLQVRLKPPHGQSNPGQFDRQLWLMAERVTAVGYVRRTALNPERPDLQSGHALLTLRSLVRQRIHDSLPEGLAASLVEGLTVGVRSGLDPEHWSVFRATGTVHLMSISGLHVGLVAGGVWWLMITLCNRLIAPGRCRWLAFAAASGCGVCYAFLAGWSVPTSRAAMMFILLGAAAVRYRAPSLSAILSTALIVTIISDPFSVLSTGFWMSYLAVWLLITMPARPQLPMNLHNYLMAARRSPSRLTGIVVAVVGLMRAQWRLTLGLTVPNIVLFDAWAVLSPVVNMIAIPLFSVLLLPAVLLSTLLVCIAPAVGKPLMMFTAWMLDGAMSGLTSLAGSAWGQSDWLSGHTALSALFMVFSTALLLPGPLRCWPVLAGLPVATALLMLSQPRAPLRIDVLDVGQGTAVLIRTRQHAMLVDTGPAWPGGDAGQATAVPYMRSLGIRRLDTVLVSHGDADHSGGLHSIQAAVPVAQVLSSAPPDGSRQQRCARGMQWQWDGVRFQVLHPIRPDGWSDNEASCVLQIEYRGARALFPGDIELASEAVLVAKQSGLRSDLVVAPHHGSNTSSGHDFVTAVRPIWVVYTTAFINRWGFPRQSVRQRWRSVGACELNTADTGALAFVWREGQGLVLQSARKQHWTRPWAVRPVPDDECLKV